MKFGDFEISRCYKRIYIYVAREFEEEKKHREIYIFSTKNRVKICGRNDFLLMHRSQSDSDECDELETKDGLLRCNCCGDYCLSDFRC